jgi:hypothetical protein
MPNPTPLPPTLSDIDLDHVTSKKWGPSEWFGCDVATVSNDERLQLAKDALLPSKAAERTCPHLTALTGTPNTCSKAGGVCAVQQYSRTFSGGISLAGHRVAICPSRLVTQDVLRTIAQKVLGLSADVVLVKEVPYSLNMTKVKKSGEPTSAGRIDWLLVDGTDPKRFAAVETQSVYMSGKSQDGTFQAFVDAGGALTMPPEYRHPDYKSSVPKRLAPQLESKARHLSSTSRKTVVIVDEFVRANMSSLVEIAVPAAYAHDAFRAEQHKRDSCQVIFAIVSLDGGALKVVELLYCSIDAAKAALDAVGPMSQAEFKKVVLDMVRPVDSKGLPKKPPAHKVFKLS